MLDMMLDDEIYFGLREYEETKAALETAEPRARAAHFEMARRYRELVDAIVEHRERLGLPKTVLIVDDLV